MRRASPLDLFDLPLVFLQRPLLLPDEFSHEARRRGVDLRPEHLETLHRAGDFYPVYRLRKDIPGARAAARRGHRSLRSQIMFTPTDGPRLLRERDEGFLIDARAEPFKPWRSFRRTVDGAPARTSEYLYSPYQLLGVGSLRGLLRRMRARRVGDEPPRWTYRLVGVTDWDRVFVQVLTPEQVILLSAVESIYLPEVRLRTSLPPGGYAEWERVASSFRPRRLLSWLGWSRDDVFEFAHWLLWKGRSTDPARRWFRLTRNVWPRRWDELEGDALASMDLRTAGEMLLRFYEDLGGRRAATAEISEMRLRREPDELETVLYEMGLSPHPAVILVLEGATEMALLPLVMAHLGLHPRQRAIRLVDGHGAESSLDTLAAYAISPGVGEDFPGGVVLTRPPTHLMVLRDAEGRKTATTSQREAVKGQWLDRIVETLPLEYRTEATRLQLEPLISVDTWAPGDPARRVFEFAHFTDYELARAITKAHRALGGSGNISAQEVARIRATSQKLADVWGGRFRPAPSKPDLALELWPALKRRIDRAVARGDPNRVPIVRVTLEAVRRAERPFGRVALFRELPS